MKNKIKAGIVGGAGYTGGELIRLLLNHPDVSISFVHSKSNAGHPVHTVHEDLQGETDIIFTSQLNNEIDILFLCLGQGESAAFLSENKIDERIKIIDLSQDFRMGQSMGSRKFIYGLPELNKAEIAISDNIANPGCFATAIQLGMLPLIKVYKVSDVYTTGITGSTGAGQGLNATSHFSWRSNNIQAYKTLNHQHLAEIGRTFLQIDPSGQIDLSFIPWRGDFTRGIFTSAQLKCETDIKELYSIYREYFAAHPFIVITNSPVFLKQVVNTNKCFIQLEKSGDKLVIHTVIDNLLKGASGQAVQNMNLMFGMDETAGLKLKASYF